MDFDIDVSGEDIFQKDYTVCIADNNSIIKGFKMNATLCHAINSKYMRGLYRYNKSKKGKTDLRIRVYCVIIYYLFKAAQLKKEINLNLCMDFNGKEEGIKSNLNFLLKQKLKLKINDMKFCKLSNESNADKYAYLMRKDTRNLLKTYIQIKLEDIEKFLE